MTSFWGKIFKNRKGHFGVHLTIDGYGGSPEKLNSYETVFKSIDELPEKIGMEKMTDTIVLEAPAVSEKDGGGYSGFVMINTSHISCHTFPKRCFVSIDVYTCLESLDQEFVKKYFREAFDLKELEVNYIERGKDYPSCDLI